jgi:hypothetical protein
LSYSLHVSQKHLIKENTVDLSGTGKSGIYISQPGRLSKNAMLCSAKNMHCNCEKYIFEPQIPHITGSIYRLFR